MGHEAKVFFMVSTSDDFKRLLILSGRGSIEAWARRTAGTGTEPAAHNSANFDSFLAAFQRMTTAVPPARKAAVHRGVHSGATMTAVLTETRDVLK